MPVGILALIALGGAACRGGGDDVSPPAYGTATCAACGAVIGDPAFAAQYRLADGAVKSFDDPGCLFDALRAEAHAPALIRFRDHGGDAWLVAPDVWFARTPSTAPHGSGWAVYPSFAAAQDAVAAAGSGEILSFAQARATLRRKAP
jgi:hypothetical protein